MNLPCCVTNEDGSGNGGPINVVIVADGLDMLRLLIRSGWNETGAAGSASSGEAIKSADIPEHQRYVPVEPLYYYGRTQDAAFREYRITDFEQNKLRVWLSPMKVEGQEVWMGQVNREYGKPSRRKSVNKIDLDEVRSFLLQDLWYAQGIRKYGFVGSAESVSPIANPKTTFRGTTYITDGYRLVIWLARDRVALSEVEIADWDRPPEK
jgi:hypothetical protein